jgi:uncharacterized protein HemX
MVRLAAMLAVLALAAMPAAATAASNPFVAAPTQQAPAQQAPAPTPAPVPTTSSNGGIGDGQVVLIMLGAVALIAGIWMVIMRDARRATAGRGSTGVRRDDDGSIRTGGRATKAAHRSRKLSSAERQRRKRGKAR